MRTSNSTAAVACCTLVAVIAILAWLVAADRDIEVLASLVATAIIPTVASLVAVDKAQKNRDSSDPPDSEIDDPEVPE